MDRIPTISEITEKENVRIRTAIVLNDDYRMNERDLMRYVMSYLSGKVNPSQVVDLIRTYLQNGRKFL